MYLEYAKASNLEFLIRYGFEVRTALMFAAVAMGMASRVLSLSGTVSLAVRTNSARLAMHSGDSEVPGNVYGGRQFEITGEELQNECPSVVLRHDLKGVVEDMTVDCHRHRKLPQLKGATRYQYKAGTRKNVQRTVLRPGHTTIQVHCR